MESMTGYSAIEKATSQFSYTIEIKSLNSRYQEVFINIPKILKSEENNFINIMKERFSRGKLELSIDIHDWVNSREVTINSKLLGKYYKEFKKAVKEIGVDNNNIPYDVLFSFDGVLQRERTVISDISLKDIYDTLEKAIKKNISMRKKEGNSTKKDLIKSIKMITDSVNKIKQLSKDVSKTLYMKLKNSIDELINSEIDEQRLYSEVAILADKRDINEEIVRLTDHIEKFKTILNESDQIGKKLDFVAQEMFREINTISSKSNSSIIAHIVVEVKNEIDKIREQCRNII